MPKAKKDGKFLNCYIKSDIMDYLNKFCEKTGFSKTAAVEKAIMQYLESCKEDISNTSPDKLRSK